MTRPGMTVLPVRSATRASAGTATLPKGPTAAIFPSRTSRVWSSRAEGAGASTSRAGTSATRGARSVTSGSVSCAASAAAPTPPAAASARSISRQEMRRRDICGRAGIPGRSVRLLDPDAPVLHLAVVALQSDGARGRDGHRVQKHLAVARAMGKAAPDGHDNLVPVERAVVRQGRERPRDDEVAALQLGLAHEDAAVRVGARAEL